MTASATGAPFHRSLHVCLALALLAPQAGCSILWRGKRVDTTHICTGPEGARGCRLTAGQLAAAADAHTRRFDHRQHMHRDAPGTGRPAGLQGRTMGRDPPLMLKGTLLLTLEDSGRVGAVATQGTA